jgi:carbon storage regulator
MLILSRKYNESIIIDGKIVVRVLRIDRDSVKLGIDAPQEVAVHRQEIYEEILRSNQEALMSNQMSVPKLARTHSTKPETAHVPDNKAEAPVEGPNHKGPPPVPGDGSVKAAIRRRLPRRNAV